MKQLIILLLICHLLLIYHVPAHASTSPVKSKNQALQARYTAISSAIPIDIAGDKTFIRRTKAALKLLQSKAPDDYAMVAVYIGKIQQHRFSGMAAYEKIPTYKVGTATAQASITWYASTIVHDAYHSKLYHDYLRTYKKAVPDEAWIGMDAEMKCLEAQIQTLIRIKATDGEIKYAASLHGTNWWDLDHDGDYDTDDENLRDW